MVHEETSFFGDEQLRARIAWYYFIAGLTQQEISDRLGIARARVNKIVGQLRADGSVVVDIRLPLASCVELEEKLKQRFDLKQVSIVPSSTDEDLQRRMIGDAAGILLDELIHDGMSIAIISFYALVEFISWHERHDLSEYSLSLIHKFCLLQNNLQKYKIKSRKKYIRVNH